MVTSTADAEECSPNGTFRFIRNFKPLQHTPTTYVAGSFSISQKLLEFSIGPLGVSAIAQMSFTPPNPESPGPWGSLLWVD